MLPPNLDAEPDAITPGETDFFFGHNSEEDGETLLAFEDLPEAVKRQITEKRKTKMIILQKRQVPSDSQPTSKGVTFLKPMHASEKGTVAKISKATADKPDNFGNPYVVFFEFGGQKYSKGFKPTSDNLASLVEILGDDESKWKDKLVTIFRVVTVDEGETTERLSFGPPPKTAKK